MTIAIMVVVAVLKSGLILQQAIHTPDRRQCEVTRPLIEEQIRREQKTLAKISSICIDFENTSFERTTDAAS